MRVVVLGGTGFIGSHVVAALKRRGYDAVPLAAPRLLCPEQAESAIRSYASTQSAEVRRLVAGFGALRPLSTLRGFRTHRAEAALRLFGANALLPRVVLDAVASADVPRLVHISSAGVQGRRQRLDETYETAPLNAYTRSKAVGEALIRADPRVVIFRPTSVHGQSRPVTARLVRLMRSPVASVAGEGTRPTPQVLVANVADAVATVVAVKNPPGVVLQPAEGLTTADLVRVLGNREPRRIPEVIARLAVTGAYSGSRLGVANPAWGRRLEMLWFGQEQVPGWLTSRGWKPIVGIEGWVALASQSGEVTRA